MHKTALMNRLRLRALTSNLEMHFIQKKKCIFIFACTECGHSHIFIDFICIKLVNTFADLLGVDEAVVRADVGYFYGAVSVGGESG